jgi:hypothetical protein
MSDRIKTTGSRPLRWTIRVLAHLQRVVRRSSALVQAVRSLRNVLHFGPWRHAFLAYRRMVARPSEILSPAPTVLAEEIDVPSAVIALERDGFVAGVSIRPEIVAASRSFWNDKSPGSYVDVHRDCPELLAIATDPQVLRIARAYFGCEATLIESKLFVSAVGRSGDLTRGYHFDHAGLRSLNVLVYLTDVDLDSGPHVLVAGTHRGKRLGDFFREILPIEAIERRHPTGVHTIVGPAGTILLENAEVFHRRLVASKKRVALITVYSTNRSRILSSGRKEARV